MSRLLLFHDPDVAIADWIAVVLQVYESWLGAFFER